MAIFRGGFGAPRFRLRFPAFRRAMHLSQLPFLGWILIPPFYEIRFSASVTIWVAIQTAPLCVVIVTRRPVTVGAKRLPSETIYMCTRDDSRGVLDVVCPVANDKHHFHICAMPERRAADGPTLQSWAFGILLGPKAVGTWSSRAEGAGFGASTGTSKSE